MDKEVGSKKRVKVNRAPVMTLWAAVVAERLGYRWEEALTFGKSVAGLNAQSKGRRLGIYEEPSEEQEKEHKQEIDQRAAKETFVDVLGRSVPAVQTPQGLRATIEDKPIDPGSVQRYLERKFGEDFGEVREATENLACAYQPSDLAAKAYSFYEKFRPDVPEGTRGWGALGVLDLDKIRSLYQ